THSEYHRVQVGRTYARENSALRARAAQPTEEPRGGHQNIARHLSRRWPLSTQARGAGPPITDLVKVNRGAWYFFNGRLVPEARGGAGFNFPCPETIFVIGPPPDPG